MSIKIDNEFRTLIPPLTEEEFSQLESNCIENGIQDSLKTWDGILIDGHNRYEIAEKHGLEYKTEEMEFSSRDDVKLWIIKNQLGRRNIDNYTRATLALKMKPLIAKKAKANQIASGGAVPQKSAKPIDTREELAKIAGVSHDTIHKVEAIENSGNADVIDKVKNKEMSINMAYREVKGLPPKKPSQPQTEVREVDAVVSDEDVMRNPLQVEEINVETAVGDESCSSSQDAIDGVPEEPISSVDVVDGVSVAELDRVMETLIRFRKCGDSLLDEIKKAKCGSDKEAFIKKLKDCERFLAHIETGLIGW